MITAYWYIGKQLLQYLSEKLMEEFGKGFNVRNYGDNVWSMMRKVRKEYYHV